MSDTADKIKVMQAFEDGENIQRRPRVATVWIDWNPKTKSEPGWNWVDNIYRIKPKPRRFWVRLHHGQTPRPTDTRGWVFVEEVLNDE